jgi:glycoprotein endo-alpha-1,2-mannosidase
VSIQEFGVYDRYRPRPDLARGKPTSATSALAGHPAAGGTDGSSATWWSAAAVPTPASPQSLTVDLGSGTSIDTVRTFSRAGSGPRHVTVSISGDGSTYTPVASVDLPNSEGPHAVVFPAASARWVRLSCSGSYSTSTAAVEQVEVFRH